MERRNDTQANPEIEARNSTEIGGISAPANQQQDDSNLNKETDKQTNLLLEQNFELVTHSSYQSQNQSPMITLENQNSKTPKEKDMPQILSDVTTDQDLHISTQSHSNTTKDQDLHHVSTTKHLDGQLPMQNIRPNPTKATFDITPKQNHPNPIPKHVPCNLQHPNDLLDIFLVDVLLAQFFPVPYQFNLTTTSNNNPAIASGTIVGGTKNWKRFHPKKKAYLNLNLHQQARALKREHLKTTTDP